jgi:hypothetical protein
MVHPYGRAVLSGRRIQLPPSPPFGPEKARTPSRWPKIILQPSNVKALKSALALDDVGWCSTIRSFGRRALPRMRVVRSRRGTEVQRRTVGRRLVVVRAALTRQLDREARESSWGAGGGGIRSAVLLRVRGEREGRRNGASRLRRCVPSVLLGKM